MGFLTSLFTGRVDEAELQERLEELKKRLPAPVIWLLGKAQSGKTSIVHALTGDSRAEIGNGFQPCTKFSSRYSFPSRAFPLVEFMDTRGLDDAAYDPSEDIEFLEKQAHLLMVVMAAADPAQRSVLRVVEQVRQRHPEWPVVVVQTRLHELYPWHEPCHIEPYPFDCEPFPPEVPADLRRALELQRSWFAGQNIRFVAVDFTLPEDGYRPQFYGLEQLWRAIEGVLPLSLRGIVQRREELQSMLRDLYDKPAEQIILTHTLLASAAAGLPIPGVDLPAILAILFHMASALAQLYGQTLTTDHFRNLLLTLGWGFGARLLGRELLKLVPWIGVPGTVVFTAASTYAFGQVMAFYFAELKMGHVPDEARLRQMFRHELAQASDHLGKRMEPSVPSRDNRSE